MTNIKKKRRCYNVLGLIICNSSNHERSELRKPFGLSRAFFLFFISYMKLRYENAKMYSLWPGNGFCDQN